MGIESQPIRILAIKLADLGDVLLCEPAFRSLRASFPDARIDVLTTPGAAGLINLIGHDLDVLPFPKHLFDSPASLAKPSSQIEALRLARRLRRSRYDRVVVLHHLTTAFGARKFAGLVAATGSQLVAGLDNGRGGFLTHRVIDRGFGAVHEALYMRDVAVAAGGTPVDPNPSISAPTVAELQTSLPDRFAAIFPATGQFSRARQWPAERYAEVARALVELGVTPVVVGSEDARSAAQTISEAESRTVDLTGKTSLMELTTVVQCARLAVGGDSFIGHLAAAVGTPVVSIFGPSNADAWRPAGSVDVGASVTSGTSLVVRQDLPCMPCIYTGFRLGRPQGCPDRTCLKRVTTADVQRAVTIVLGAEE